MRTFVKCRFEYRVTQAADGTVSWDPPGSPVWVNADAIVEIYQLQPGIVALRVSGWPLFRYAPGTPEKILGSMRLGHGGDGCYYG